MKSGIEIVLEETKNENDIKDAEVCNEHGIDAYFPIARGDTTLQEALNTDNVYKNLTAIAFQVFRLIIG